MKIHALITVILLTLVAGHSESASALIHPYNGLVVFGDSLSDNGNLYADWGVFMDFIVSHTDGHVTNGTVWADWLAELMFGTPGDGRYANFAYAGAMTDGPFLMDLFVNDVYTQTRSQYTATPTGNELFVIWAGANDYLGANHFNIKRQTDHTVPVGNIRSSIEWLADKGGMHFLVPNLPSLGETPRYKGTATETQLADRIAGHNQLLDTSLDTFAETHPDIDIIKFDSATLLQQFQATPDTWQFTNTTDQVASATPGTDTSGYLFWDDIHPSGLAHQSFARAVFESTISTVVELRVLKGDVDNDGSIDNFDITPFIAALPAANEAAFLIQFPTGNYAAADIDMNGTPDNLDITPFIALLAAAGTNATAVPAPTSIVCFVLTLMIGAKRSAKR